MMGREFPLPPALMYLRIRRRYAGANSWVVLPDAEMTARGQAVNGPRWVWRRMKRSVSSGAPRRLYGLGSVVGIDEMYAAIEKYVDSFPVHAAGGTR